MSLQQLRGKSRVLCPAFFFALLSFNILAQAELPAGWIFEKGGGNRVAIALGDAYLGFYDYPESIQKRDWLLSSHHRRDLLEATRDDVAQGARLVVPAHQVDLVTQPQLHWQEFWRTRFHYYEQQSTKILQSPLKVRRSVSDGDVLEIGETSVHVVDTPGYTRDSVTYWLRTSGMKIGFTGHLILKGGKIPDLYSFQDAIPEAKIRGYHGYAGRLADLVSSLERIKRLDLDLLVPASGPVIEDVSTEIDLLLSRVRALYRNYLSTSALHWYFKEDRMRICAERVLGEGVEFELMPYTRHDPMPEWIMAHATSRVILSDSGAAFLIDCGYPKVIEFVKGLIEQGRIKRVEGIFATHIHDDHTNQLQTASEAFDCPVYVLRDYADVIAQPGSWFLPGLTENGVSRLKIMEDGESLKWHEYQLGFRFFPAQTFYHGALLAVPEGRAGVMFLGDGFTPSGMDDYCLLNRNLMDDSTGYFRCMGIIDEVLEEGHGLMNQHVTHVFYYNDQQMNRLRESYKARRKVLASLTNWDHVDYSLDEQWARFYPYGQTLESGTKGSSELNIENHLHEPMTVSVSWNLPDDWRMRNVGNDETVKARDRGRFELGFDIPSDAKSGVYVITADVSMNGKEFTHWAETLIRIE